MSGNWNSHPTEALVPAVGHFLLKIGHDDRLVPAEVAREVGEAREPHEGLQILVIEPLVEGLVGRVLDAGAVQSVVLLLFSGLLLVPFLGLLG